MSEGYFRLVHLLIFLFSTAINFWIAAAGRFFFRSMAGQETQPQ
jgi:hypothetical protein